MFSSSLNVFFVEMLNWTVEGLAKCILLYNVYLQTFTPDTLHLITVTIPQNKNVVYTYE